MDKQFSLKKPCANCPFRNDGQAIDLMPGRKEEIIESLLNGESMTFSCHKTVYRPDGVNFNDDGEYTPKEVSHCPGAAAVARKFGRDTVAVQVASRLGFIDEDHYDGALEGTLEPQDLQVDETVARI